MVAPARVSGHPIRAALAEFERILASAPPIFDEQQQDLMQRARAMARIMNERLNDSAVDIISDTALNNGHSWIQQASNELQQAVSTGQPQVLQNGPFLSAIDTFSQSLGQFPVSIPAEALAGQLDEANRRVATIQEIQVKASADARAIQDQQNDVLRDARARVEDELTGLADQRDSAANLLSALGGTATAKGYSDTAEAEKQSADNWRKITMGLGLVAAVLALVLFTVGHEPGYESLIRRAGVTLPFVLATIYAARQAAEHRKEERTARRLQLAFGSVNAYLSDLDKTQRAELKSNLSSRLFGNEESEAIAVAAPAGFPGSSELVQIILEAAARGRSGS